MVQILRSLNGNANKTGLITCKAGDACTAGNLVVVMAGGTNSPTSGNTIKSSSIYVEDVTDDVALPTVIGIAKNTTDETSGVGSTPGDVEVQTVEKGIDVLYLPYTNDGAAAGSNNVAAGTSYGLVVGTSAFAGQTTVDFGNTTSLQRCMLVLSVDTTNKMCEALYMGPIH